MSIRVRLEEQLNDHRFGVEIEADTGDYPDTLATIMRAASEAIDYQPQPTFTDQPTEYPAPTPRSKKRARPR
jgi:hypothetical protein